MFHIAEALTRWITPILSFTAEEINEALPGQRPDSVLLNTWYDGLYALPAESDLSRDYWNRLIEVKDAVNKCLEDARNEKLVKGSLGAEAILYVSDELKVDLERLGEELRFVLLTSEVTLKPLAEGTDARTTDLASLKVSVQASEKVKCARCWHHREDVGSHAAHPSLCGRCITNLPEGEGESRSYS